MLISETCLFSQKLDGKLRRGEKESEEEKIESMSREEQRERKEEQRKKDKIRESSMC